MLCLPAWRRAAGLGLVAVLGLGFAAGCTTSGPSNPGGAGAPYRPDVTVDGHRYAVPGLPAPDDNLRLSCAGRDFCVIVDPEGLSWFWHGSGWTGPVRFAPAGTDVSVVSCPSTTFCMAGAGTGTFVWNGTGWASTPPATWSGSAATLTGTVGVLACAGPAYCLAGPAGDKFTGVRAWRGTTWSAAPEVDTYDRLTALGCARDGDTCAAVGKEIDVHHGGAWSGEPFSAQDVALDVSCTAGPFCMAALHDDYAVWRGGTWSEQTLDYGIQLGNVSCASATFCLGDDREGIAVWNGSQWSPGPTFPSDAQPLPLDVAGGFLSCPTDGWCMFAAAGITYVYSE
jgi:hypothetical protein